MRRPMVLVILYLQEGECMRFVESCAPGLAVVLVHAVVDGIHLLDEPLVHLVKQQLHSAGVGAAGHLLDDLHASRARGTGNACIAAEVGVHQAGAAQPRHPRLARVQAVQRVRELAAAREFGQRSRQTCRWWWS